MAKGKDKGKDKDTPKDKVTKIVHSDGTVVERVEAVNGDKYHKRKSEARFINIERSYYKGK